LTATRPRLVIVPPGEVAALLDGPDVPAAHDLDEMAVPTYMHANPLARWLFWRRHRTILGLARIQPDETALDFGTGTGALLPSLCAATRQVWATDLHDALARRLVARRGLSVKFFVSAQLDAAIADGALDVTIAADVLEHIEAPQLSELLRLFRRKLSPGGRLVVSLPTENALYKLGRIVAGYAGKGHYHRTTLQSFLEASTRAGFAREAARALPAPGPGCLFSIMRLVPAACG
jgi:SAM-dependent methyltransferase